MRFKIVISALFMLLLWGCSEERPVDWTKYYESQYKTPYGTEIFLKELEFLFPYADVEQIKSKTKLQFEDYSDYSNATYMYINKTFYNDSLTSSRLLNFSQFNNSLFIATEDFDNVLFRPYAIETQYTHDSTVTVTLNNMLKSEVVTNVSNTYKIEDIHDSLAYFTSYPENAVILGTVEIGNSINPNYICYSIANSSSRIYLHANPELFTNFHMLNKLNGVYAKNTLSHLTHTYTVLWDGFSTARRYYSIEQEGGASDLLRYIKKNKSLFYAFIAIASAILLFLAFNYKRITRSIPIKREQKNNSLAFMKIVATLFMNDKNHIDLARYRANYILDIVKSNHHLNTSEINEEFQLKLAEKTNIEAHELNPFTYQINKARKMKTMSKNDFVHFNKVIESTLIKLKLHDGKSRRK